MKNFYSYIRRAKRGKIHLTWSEWVTQQATHAQTNPAIKKENEP